MLPSKSRTRLSPGRSESPDRSPHLAELSDEQHRQSGSVAATMADDENSLGNIVLAACRRDLWRRDRLSDVLFGLAKPIRLGRCRAHQNLRWLRQLHHVIHVQPSILDRTEKQCAVDNSGLGCNYLALIGDR